MSWGRSNLMGFIFITRLRGVGVCVLNLCETLLKETNPVPVHLILYVFNNWSLNKPAPMVVIHLLFVYQPIVLC